jgi:hypothetical protein
MRQLPALRIRLPAPRHPHQTRRNPARFPLRQSRESAEAIFLLKDYAITGLSRAEMVHDKAKLYELGGTLPMPIHKWDANK